MEKHWSDELKGRMKMNREPRPMIKDDGRDHAHKATNPGSIYEYCECGAVRKADRAGVPKDEWHVCDLCRLPGFGMVKV